MKPFPRIVIKKIHDVEIVFYQGDITLVEADAIVNAANSGLLGGGGVDGAIHQRAGKKLFDECMVLHKQGGCPSGEARITTGGNLLAKYVIHTVGPIWYNGTRNEAETLTNCYRNSILLAEEYKLSSIIFSSISTGVFGYPLEKATKIGKKTVMECINECKHLKCIGWCLFDVETFYKYQKVWEANED